MASVQGEQGKESHMKRLMLSLAVVALCASAAFAIFGSGYGRTVSVTEVTSRIDGFTANKLSIYNAGAATVYALPNLTTNEFNVHYAAGTTIPIPGGMSFTFDGEGEDHVASLCWRTVSSTNVCYVGAW
jgi:hypothetical protein